MTTLQKPPVWSVRFVSDHRPPFPLASFKVASREHSLPCGMEVIAIATGQGRTDVPRGVHPILASMVRLINDAISNDVERTEILWPLLPRIIGSGMRHRRWEAELYSYVLGRELSALEVDRITGPRDGYSLGVMCSMDLAERFVAIEEQVDLFIFAIRGYWSRADTAPMDWTEEHIARLAGWLETFRSTE